ncbi:MAG TPA: hypothetical protein VM532_13700 [Burkholderiales bacterium]|nr:hypothetical protein [Burkholderiales bacterium]
MRKESLNKKLLPGGLIENGERRRDYAFRPPTGAMELAVTQAAERSNSTPAAVTQALVHSLEHIADGPPTEARINALCVADRQFLMRELARHLGNAGGWFEADCKHCDARFNFSLDYADLPVREAGDGYPFAEVAMDFGRVRLRLPTGADQIRLAGKPADHEHALLESLLVEVSHDATVPTTLNAEALAAIETALEAVSPEVLRQVAAACPECGKANNVDLNPYTALTHDSREVLTDVHRIALHYHWGEAEILALPRKRRHDYLRLIDQARGMTG